MGASLSKQADQTVCGFSTRWRLGCAGASGRGGTARETGAANPRRQPSGRKHHTGHRVREEPACRRLHAVVCVGVVFDQSQPLQTELRHRERFLASDCRRHRAAAADYTSQPAGAHGERHHCARQGAAGQARLRLVRHRQRRASGGRDDAVHDRNQHGACTLQGQCPRSGGRDRRACDDDDAGHRLGDQPRARQEAARHRGHHREARHGCAGYPDGR